MGIITVADAKLNKRRLTSQLIVSKDLEKYIKNDELFIEYDAEINSNTSILNIPLTAAVLPFAWLTGSDIHVGSIDKTFISSMDDLKNIFKEMYPKASFETKIIANEIVENKNQALDPAKRTGLLFSGGVDASFTMISHFELNPQLIMLWGVDNFPYPERSDHWEKAISIYSEYAKRKNLDFHIVKTNISQIINDRRLEHRFHKEIYNGMFRFALQHSLILLPTVAPLSVGRFDRLLIAASGSPSSDRRFEPDAAIATVDEKIIWSDLFVKNHGDVSRVDKVISIIDARAHANLTLRVCLRSKLVDGYLNDNECEKCLRNIACLAYAGADPNSYGFNVDESTFKKMRSFWANRKTTTFGTTWHELRELVSDNIEHDIYGSRDFFEWFKDFDLTSTKRNWFYTDLYTSLPYILAKKLDQLYSKIGVSVHEASYIREKDRADN